MTIYIDGPWWEFQNVQTGNLTLSYSPWDPVADAYLARKSVELSKSDIQYLLIDIDGLITDGIFKQEPYVFPFPKNNPAQEVLATSDGDWAFFQDQLSTIAQNRNLL